MPARGRVLILAGTVEARRVCEACADRDVLASLAGRTTGAALPVPVRMGGFGGDEGFRAALQGVAAVLDATHPFAARVGARAAAICVERAIPYLRLARPGFGADPSWTRHADAEACAASLPAGARVLLTVGPGGVDPFLGQLSTLWCRAIERPPARDGVEWIVGRPSDDAGKEAATMRDRGITHLVTKDSGGSRAKLDAAAMLAIAVHVIDRPPPGPGEETHDLDRAAAFVRAHSRPHPRGR